MRWLVEFAVVSGIAAIIVLVAVVIVATPFVALYWLAMAA